MTSLWLRAVAAELAESLNCEICSLLCTHLYQTTLQWYRAATVATTSSRIVLSVSSRGAVWAVAVAAPQHAAVCGGGGRRLRQACVAAIGRVPGAEQGTGTNRPCVVAFQKLSVTRTVYMTVFYKMM